MISSELSLPFLIGMVVGALLLAVAQFIYRRVFLWLDRQQVSGALEKGETPQSWVEVMDEFEQSEAWVESELKNAERQQWKDH